MERLDFGLDAPNIVRNLFIASLLPLVLFIGIFWFFQDEKVLTVLLKILMILSFVILIATAILMLLSSRIFKIRNRNRLIELLKMSNEDNILDVGCGRGLYTIGIASRLTTGKVYGIDIWNQEDISNNSESSIAKNIRISGLTDRILLMTQDMRNMSFADGFFDVVIASFSIHNIYETKEREKALSEIYRVTKNTGKIVITDFRYIKEYVQYFISRNCELKVRSIAPGVFPAAKNLIFQKRK